MKNGNNQEYGTMITEYSAPCEEIAELHEEISSNAIEINIPAAECTELIEEYSVGTNESEEECTKSSKQKANLLKQAAMALATVVIVTNVATSTVTMPEETVVYYPELVPILTEMQEYMEQQELEDWESLVKANNEFLTEYTVDKVGRLVFEGEECYTLTHESDFSGIVVGFKSYQIGDDEYVGVDVYQGDFTDNLINGDMTYAGLKVSEYSDGTLCGYYFTYENTEWKDSKLVGEYFSAESDPRFNLYDMDERCYGKIGPREQLTGTVTLERDDNGEVQKCNVDENGLLIMDDYVVDLTKYDFIPGKDGWSYGESKDGILTYTNSITGEVIETDRNGKVVVIREELNGDTTSWVAVLTCHGHISGYRLEKTVFVYVYGRRIQSYFQGN